LRSGLPSNRPAGRNSSELFVKDAVSESHQKCPECGRENIHATTTNSGGHHGPYLLPHLGGFLRFATFEVRVCANCGFTRFYADAGARTKLPVTNRWKRI
jgi:predicted nucleic-acid-binding Zn-ribbon protein